MISYPRDGYIGAKLGRKARKALRHARRVHAVLCRYPRPRWKEIRKRIKAGELEV